MNIISNYNFPIYEQDDLSYNIKFKINNFNTICNFGFENLEINKKINFLLSGGEIFNQNNESLFAVEKNGEISISGNIKPNYYIISQNNFNSENQRNIFNINNFYLNTSQEVQDFSLKIDGKKIPILSTSILNNPSTTGEHVTGILINSGDKNIILTDIILGGYYNLTGQIINNIIGPNQTGKFLLLTSGLALGKNSEVSINLYGNFGYQNYKEIIYTIEENNKIFEIEPYKTESINTNLVGSKSYDKYKIYINRKDLNSYQNIKKSKNVFINFEYFSGSKGNLQINKIEGTGLNNINYTGYITGSGNLQKNQEVFLTGYDVISQKNVTGKSLNNKNYISNLYYLNGNYNQQISVTGSGFVFGGYENQKNNFIVTGETQVVNYSGYVNQYDVIFNTGFNFIGIGDDGFGNLQSGNIKNMALDTGVYFEGNSSVSIKGVIATGVARGLGKNVIFNNTGYATGIVSGYITGSGYLKSDNITYLTTGYIVGDISNARIIKNINRQIYSDLNYITGNLNYQLKEIGTGIATGDYTNTDITGNITLATGIREFLGTGIALNGSGILYGMGYGVLSNNYGEEELVIYTGAKSFYALGNPNYLNDPINIYNYQYSITGTGLGVYTLQDNLNYKENSLSNVNSNGITGVTNDVTFTGIINYSNNQDASFAKKITLIESGNSSPIREQVVRYFKSSDQSNQIFNYNFEGYVTGSGIVNRPLVEENYFTGINYNINLTKNIASGIIYSESIGNYNQTKEFQPDSNFMKNSNISGFSAAGSPASTYLPRGAGNSSAISDDGNIKVVGWSSANFGSGIVISKRGTGDYAYFTENQIISGIFDSRSSNDQFGYSLAMNKSGNILAIGAPGQKVNNVSGCGAVYVYTGNSNNEINYWEFSQVISPFFPGPYLPMEQSKMQNMRFGTSLAFDDSGKILAIGAPKCASLYNLPLGTAEEQGAVYIFSKNNPNANTYQAIQKIPYPYDDPLLAEFRNNYDARQYLRGGARFGEKIAFDGYANKLLISAPADASQRVVYPLDVGDFYGLGTIWVYEKQAYDSDGLPNPKWYPTQRIPTVKNSSWYYVVPDRYPRDYGVSIDRNGQRFVTHLKTFINLDLNETNYYNKCFTEFKDEMAIYKYSGSSFVLETKFSLPTNKIAGEICQLGGQHLAINASGDIIALGLPYTGKAKSLGYYNTLDPDQLDCGKSPYLYSSSDYDPFYDNNQKRPGQVNIYINKTGTWSLATGIKANHIKNGYDLLGDRDFFGVSISMNSIGNKMLIGAPWGYYGGSYEIYLNPTLVTVTGNFDLKINEIIYNEEDKGFKNLNTYDTDFSLNKIYANENLTNATGLITLNYSPILGIHSFTGTKNINLNSYNFYDLNYVNYNDKNLFEIIKNKSPKIKKILGSYSSTRLKGTGFVEKKYNNYNYTGSLTKMSGNLPVFGIQEGEYTINDFTGYNKNINEIVYGFLKNPTSLYSKTSIATKDIQIPSSGNLNVNIYRTGYYQQVVSGIVTGSFYSQKEFNYTGELTKNINVDITNPLGFMQTGIFLSKNKNLIDLSNYNYNGKNINLYPITNLEKSGQYNLYATGYKQDFASGVVKSSILTDEIGTFYCTGLIDFNKNYYFDQTNKGKRNIIDFGSGNFINPKILNNSGYVEGQYIATGYFNKTIIGSGMMNKSFQVTPISYIKSGERLTGVHLDYKILNKNINGNVVSGIIEFNNNITGTINDAAYTGYFSKSLATGYVNFTENILETGYIVNPDAYFQRNFTDFFDIKTGYYDISGNITGLKSFKTNNMINNEKYIGSGYLSYDIDFIHLQIDKMKDYNNDIIVGKLIISGESEGLTNSISTYISGKGGLD